MLLHGEAAEEEGDPHQGFWPASALDLNVKGGPESTPGKPSRPALRWPRHESSTPDRERASSSQRQSLPAECKLDLGRGGRKGPAPVLVALEIRPERLLTCLWFLAFHGRGHAGAWPSVGGSSKVRKSAGCLGPSPCPFLASMTFALQAVARLLYPPLFGTSLCVAQQA